MNKGQLNGRDEAQEFEPLRFVIFGESIVSDWGNPVATTSRAVCRALAALGHEVVFLEQRRNAPTVGVLEERGYGPVRSFADHFADIHYRTYEILPEREQSVWLGREATTSDVMIILADAPPEVARGLAAIEVPYLLTLVEDSDASTSERLGLRGLHDAEIEVPYGPAVLRHGESETPSRSAPLVVVAYDDAALAVETASALESLAPQLAAAGQAELPEWPVVPESSLPELYRQAAVVVIVGAGEERGSLARSLLPVSFGCQVVSVERRAGEPVAPGFAPADPATVRSAVERAMESGLDVGRIEVPRPHDAGAIAARLVEAAATVRLPRT